jgi:CDGSH-type Zn-finger protein
MTTARKRITAILDQHKDMAYDGPKRQWQCRCGVPLSEDTPAIDHRAHLIEQLLAATKNPQVNTTAELEALPDRTVVQSAAGTIANLVGDSAFFFGYEASVSRRMLDLPVTVLQLGTENV